MQITRNEIFSGGIKAIGIADMNMSQQMHRLIFYYADLRGENFAFEILRYHVGVGSESENGRTASEATVKLKIKEETRHTVAEGNGPVSALDHALRQALEKDFPYIKQVRLVDFKVRILESNLGTDAITRVHIESTDGEKTWGTVGVSDNVITASWALVDSVSYKILLNLNNFTLGPRGCHTQGWYK